MSTIIKLRCLDQVLTFESTPVIASGGLEEDFLQVSFCSKWDGLTKTAVFWRSEKEAFHVLLDENDSCAIPHEVLTDEGVIYFGLFGVSADGRQRTSEAMRYTIAKGAITSGTKPSDPTPDIYSQLLEKYGQMVEIAADTRAKEQAFEQAMTERQGAYEEAMTQRQADHETAVGADQQAFEQSVAQTQAAFEQAQTERQAAYEQQILDMLAAGLLPDDSVSTEKIKDGAITKDKIADGVLEKTVTDETKALFGLDSSATSDDVLKLLSGAALAQSVPKFKQHVVANPAYNKAVGDTVTINVGGVATDFIVVHRGSPDSSLYDASCDGIWLLMKDSYKKDKWHSSETSDYGASAAHSYLNGSFLNLVDGDVRRQIKTVKVPYMSGAGSKSTLAAGADGLSTQVFMLSGMEVGLTTSVNNGNYLPADGVCLDYFDGAADSARVATFNGSTWAWWLRSPFTTGTTMAWYIDNDGEGNANNVSNTNVLLGYRPAFILPYDAEATYYTDLDGTEYTEQEYTDGLANVFGEKVLIHASQIVGGANIVTGSYVGTGVYGVGNENSITFDFVPKLFFLRGEATTKWMLFINTASGQEWTLNYGKSTSSFGDLFKYTFNGKTFTWWSTRSALSQGNTAGTVYDYYAVG